MTHRPFRPILYLVILLCIGCNRSNTPHDTLPQLSLTLPVAPDKVTRDHWTTGCTLRVDDRHTRGISPVSVKLRGHSTADKPKRPYTLKLPTRGSLLGLPPHKRYVLLAGFFDHSLMRNAFAFEVARCTSLALTTPQGRFVHLTINDTYQGIYYLCEAAKDMTRNHLIEVDAYAAKEDEHTFHTTHRQLPASVKRPDHPTPWQMDLLRNTLDKAELTLDSLHLDLTTFADYWLVSELCMNAEPNGPRSCYLHIADDGRVAAGPVWDFDMSFNPVGVDAGGDLRPTRFKGHRQARWLTTDSLYNPQSLWYGTLLANDAFRTLVLQRWQLLRPRFEQLTQYIDSIDHLIGPSAALDQQQWNSLEPARFDTCTTYTSAVATLRAIYTERIAKLDSIIGSMRHEK